MVKYKYSKKVTDLKAQNTLANRIDTAGEMISYDESCKQILANRIILAWILKTCVKEYKDCSVEEITDKFIEEEPEISKTAVHIDEKTEFIIGQNTENATITEGMVRFDIKFKATLPGTGDVTHMCNLSEGVYDMALVDAIKKLMNNKGWNIDECMDILEIPIEKREAYKTEILGEPVLI